MPITFKALGRKTVQNILAVAATIAVAGILSVGHAHAAPKLLQKFNAWSAYVNEDGAQKLCFVISQPTSSEMNPAGRNRGPGYFFISYRPAENVTGEVSAAFGYPLSANSTRAQIGNTNFPLFARDETAWIENAADEPRLVEAMKAGASMRIFGRSTRGTTTVDTYSLSGVTAAINRVAQECG
ncbi:MAG: hypothetical protein AAF619_05010 [Pseudomonadota bacterium]